MGRPGRRTGTLGTPGTPHRDARDVGTPGSEDDSDVDGGVVDEGDGYMM